MINQEPTLYWIGEKKKTTKEFLPKLGVRKNYPLFSQ
jgi:hypothetical protein